MTEGEKFNYSGDFANSQFGGDGSSFTQNFAGGQEVALGADVERVGSLIRELMALIPAHADRIDHPERAGRDAEEILNEVAQPEEERDPGRVADAFKRLRARLLPIAEFSESLGRIAEAIGRIIPA
jgi:hypothetical protein